MIYIFNSGRRSAALFLLLLFCFVLVAASGLSGFSNFPRLVAGSKQSVATIVVGWLAGLVLDEGARSVANWLAACFPDMRRRW